MNIKSTVIFQFILLSCVALLLSGCGGSEKKQEETKELSEEELREIKAEIVRKFKYPIPTAFEVADMLNKTKAGFVIGITNSPDSVDKYFTQVDKGLNLGIYGADLSYVTTFNREDETMEYLDATKKLVDELDIQSTFNQDFVERVEDNLENHDVLINLITESFYDTYNVLNEKGEDKLSLLVIAGSWIEGVYITSQYALATSGYDDTFKDIIAAQKAPLNELVSLMEQHSDDENINRVLPTLRYLKEVYDRVGEDLTPAQLDDIAENVESIRTQIVS